MSARIFPLFVPSALALLALGCARAPAERVEWPVMGTVAAVQTRGSSRDSGHDAAVGAATSAFSDVEALLNAHCPTSEVSRLAALPDAQVVESCSAEMRPCYEAAFMLREMSGGAFDPRWRGPGTLDLGAIAKGFAVDLAAGRMEAARGRDVLIDLGGNVKSAGGTWRTGVRSPDGGGFAAVVDLREGEALATSATYFRGRHIFDGRTGRPAENGVASVTVLCRSAMLADGLSTALFVLGPVEGRGLVGRLASAGRGQAAVLWIMSDGRRASHDPEGRFAAAPR